MILLIGPDNWASRVKRMLTDRTYDGNTDKKVHIATSAEQIRGVDEHIEIVVCTGNWWPSYRQLETISFAKHINESRRAAVDGGKPKL